MPRFSMDEIGDLINSGQTIEVVLQGGAPWGFSLKGGAEHHCPLTIAKVRCASRFSMIHTDLQRCYCTLSLYKTTQLVFRPKSSNSLSII